MNIVLVHPEIPQNTGNIARTCAATGAVLHLVEPLGFEISDRYLKRAGLDYWHLMTLKIHKSLEAFFASCPEGARMPETLLAERYDECVRIPMRPEARSLNLSNSVAIVLYEALRQQGFPGLRHEGRLTQPIGEWKDYV